MPYSKIAGVKVHCVNQFSDVKWCVTLIGPPLSREPPLLWEGEGGIGRDAVSHASNTLSCYANCFNFHCSLISGYFVFFYIVPAVFYFGVKAFITLIDFVD